MPEEINYRELYELTAKKLEEKEKLIRELWTGIGKLEETFDLYCKKQAEVGRAIAAALEDAAAKIQSGKTGAYAIRSLIDKFNLN